LGKEKE
jgi:ADP-dependent phosphofructokinase/glucokinase